MASSQQQQFLAPKVPQQQVKQITLNPEMIQTIKEKLKELGPGPYTPEQQKQKENLLKYLSYDTQSAQQMQLQQQQQQLQQQQLQQQQLQQQQLQQQQLQQQQLQQQQLQQQQLQQQQAQQQAQQQQAQQQTQQQQQQQATTTTTSNESSTTAVHGQVLDKRGLQDLVKEVDPTEQLDEDVEDLLLQVADDFIENIINSSCQLAKHRKSNILEVKDVQFHLERNFNLWIPGFSTEDLKPFKKSFASEAHKQRLQLIKKSAKPEETTNSKLKSKD